MTSPSLVLRLPDGSRRTVGPEEVLGRSSVATVRIDDPRVSTIHAELSWRTVGPVLLARGGRLRVNGRAMSEVHLVRGTRVELAPGVGVQVEEIHGEAAALVTPTEGKDSLRFVVTSEDVAVFRQGHDGAVVTLQGNSAAIVRFLLDQRGEPVRWDTVAAVLWPDEGRIREAARTWTDIDERRFRNRWDQALRIVRQQLAPARDEWLVEVRGGLVLLVLRVDDVVA